MSPRKRKNEDMSNVPFKKRLKLFKERSVIEKKKILRSFFKSKDTPPQEMSVSEENNQRETNDASVQGTAAYSTKCKFCKQGLLSISKDNLIDAISESEIIKKSHMSLVDDKENLKAHPYMNLTEFCIYDSNLHLCAMDGGLLESNVKLYFNGYLKNICDTSPNIDENSVPVDNVGPIDEWFFIGYDGGSNNCITLCTEIGDYNLLNPSEKYKPFMRSLYEKCTLSKTIVEYVEKNEHLKPSYGDLLAHISKASIVNLDDEKITEDLLKKHSSFICNHIMEMKLDDGEESIITLPCLKEIIKKFDVKLESNDTQPQKLKTYKNYKKMKKAVTTPTVRKIFEKIFPKHIKNLSKKIKSNKCGICDNCLLPDCGTCDVCKDMLKFGGTKVNSMCIHKECLHLKQRALSGNRSTERFFGNTTKIKYFKNRIIHWIGNPIDNDNDKSYFLQVGIDNFTVEIGSFVLVQGTSDLPPEVTKIQYIWRDDKNPDKGYFHGHTFYRSSDTVLGEIGDPSEVFMTHSCYLKVPLTFISQPVKVIKLDVFNSNQQKPEEHVLYYQKLYDKENARFEDIPPDPVYPITSSCINFCPMCENRLQMYNKKLIKPTKQVESCAKTMNNKKFYMWDDFVFDGVVYKTGSGIFLRPETFNLSNSLISQNKSKQEEETKVDESIYTEYYRKVFDPIKESKMNISDPYCVGYIESIHYVGDIAFINPYDVFIQVRMMFRPENIPILKDLHNFDTNLVYWSEEKIELGILDIVGICELSYIKNIPDRLTLDEWFLQNPKRFYFKECFDKARNCISEIPIYAKYVGFWDLLSPNSDLQIKRWKGKGKGKGSSNHRTCFETIKVEPLKSMDIFAGCGGLSEGLHRSGVAVSHWAIENAPSAAHAYQLNNEECCVFEDDCNSILSSILSGAEVSDDCLMLPKRGEVELLCAGPPCQGFSSMNRFLTRDYSNFKNSLIATALSFCDYYRPKYFILENVRNFASYKGGMILKMTLSCLVQMGYQCSFGVLQAGNFGLPQSRRRLFIIAAAPGLKLPQFPKPTHVFNNKTSPLSVTIDQVTYNSNCLWDDSAPIRTCTVYDAISDLPPIENKNSKYVLDYESEPKTHFQRIVRRCTDNKKLKEHVCKFMPSLVLERISKIPKTPGSDWRDLPNISITLADGTNISTLKYTHESSQGSVPNALIRGVCSCAEGRPCDPADRQRKTLIPWGMVHSADRNNSWAGSYGRLSWDGYFSTTITDPEPSGKQGRVIHPDQDRVISVREAARSQGFPDTFKYCGSMQNKYEQIGNAVPPPLAAAIGREIKKSLIDHLIRTQ